jgi:hypothetical protein
MSSLGDRKRIEIPGSLYHDLEMDATGLGVSTAALATMLLSTALRQARERSLVPFYGTGPAAPAKAVAAAKGE